MPAAMTSMAKFTTDVLLMINATCNITYRSDQLTTTI